MFLTVSTTTGASLTSATATFSSQGQGRVPPVEGAVVIEHLGTQGAGGNYSRPLPHSLLLTLKGLRFSLAPAEPLLVFPVCDVVLVLDVAVQGAVEEAGIFVTFASIL